jgi:DNA-binding NarL/FixJ family response regulator
MEKRTTNVFIASLTKSEKAILELAATGLYYKEIAAQKCLALDTVKKHICNAIKKLNVRNKTEAIQLLRNADQTIAYQLK